jgi:nitric oxide synthase oxygenase domain/subunit
MLVNLLVERLASAPLTGMALDGTVTHHSITSLHLNVLAQVELRWWMLPVLSTNRLEPDLP